MWFPYSYFEDEVRDGFYVPSMMKRAWAAQLEVLEDIRKVCEKHQIQYFAEWGTLLGAVRHEGFIPWDDDMDICMKREDYNRFLSIAKRELPKGYQVMSFRNGYHYWEMLTRVLNAEQISFDQSHLEKFHGFPFIAGIDIFPLDFLAAEEKEEEVRDHVVNFISSVANTIENTNWIKDETEEKLCQIEELCGVKIDRNKAVKRQLYILMDQMFSLYSENEAEYITMMPLWLKKRNYKFPKSYYQETIMFPFENTEVPVPIAYDAILRMKYFDYMIPFHAWDTHDYPFYKSQARKLEQYGVKPYRYVFSAGDLRKEKCAVRRTVKKQAGKMVSLLGKVHSEIMRKIAYGNTAEALKMLENCQRIAIDLGTMIEKSVGENLAIVGMLEEYCEIIYQMHERIVRGSSVMLDDLYEDLRTRMTCMEDAVKEDAGMHLEVVFLPYKASMWDSFESVWKAAKEDPECSVYVIPIPYYDKNLDGSFREMHYEGNQYPEYVPVTWYENYDFAERHPDIIFIHNPYDEYNCVTSVHPFFYSKNLKQFTDRLVYIPYFILDEIRPENKRAILSMEHFVTVPGVIHADLAIVQSENMKQAYLNALVKFAGESTRRIWEKKVLGLGSPKFDKIQGVKREQLIIPEEWRKVIEKTDGSWKKIILYNTSISALLANNQKMLEKIEDVFRLLKENNDKVALLWRPHPLMETTIESMRPQLLEDYRKIVIKYREEGWGIYDDSADIDRAMVLSDAYYGDGSSLAVLYQTMNKPLVIQSVNVLYEKEMTESLWSYHFVADGDCIWFVPYYYNRLCKYNCSEKRISLLKQIPVKNTVEGLYSNINKLDHYIILLPFRANDICIYNILEDEMTMIPLNEMGQTINKFGISSIWNGQVYLFPFDYPAICKLNVENGTVEYITSWRKTEVFQDKKYFFRWDYHLEKNIVYLLSAQSNHIFRFDMEDDTFEIIPVGECSECYSTIFFESESKIYLSNQYGDVVIYDPINRKTETIKNTLSEIQIYYDIPSEVYFIGHLCIGESIYYIPGQMDRIMEFNRNTLELKECQKGIDDRIESERNLNFTGSMFSVCQQKNGVVRGFHMHQQYFFEIDIRTKERKYHFITLDQEMLMQSAKDQVFEPFTDGMDRRHMESASFHYNLKTLMQAVQKNKGNKPADITLCGNKIYEALKTDEMD